ncbi:MAG: SCO family protein [Spirochaetales bacterium]|nr:SCO family protein [Spirochaetales bacterium]
MKATMRLVQWPLFFLFLCSCREELPVLPVGGDITLTSQDGQPYRLFSGGKPAWIFFGFTTCPDVCPATLARLAESEKELGEDIGLIFITVDTVRDTPAVLKAYLSRYRFRQATGLTGSREEIAQAARLFATFFDSSDPALIVHQSRIFLIDEKGQVRHMFRGSESPTEIAALSRRLYR